MITNIIDRRKQPYRFKKVNAVIEPTRHDNRVKNADRAPADREMDAQWIGYDEQEHVTVDDAVRWAWAHNDDVTLYLYDKEAGIYDTRKRKRTKKRRA